MNNFRHNNLTIDSFMVEKRDIDINLKLEKYNFRLRSKYIVKLFNYRRSTLKEVKNDVECNEDNPSYDIYRIIKSIIKGSNSVNKKRIREIGGNIMGEDIIEMEIKDEVS